VVARRKSASHARLLSRLSLCFSILGITIGILLLICLIVAFYPSGYCGVVDSDWNRTAFWSDPTTATPEVTSPPCHLVGNGTTCFRFKSGFKAAHCSKIGGFTVTTNTSSAAEVLQVGLSSTVCYHNVCRDYIVETTCFQYRSAFFVYMIPLITTTRICLLQL